MYRKLRLKDSVRVPPSELGKDLEEVVARALQEKLEGRVDRDLGVYIAVTEINGIGEGKIVSGDGGVYYEVDFGAITFLPEVNEMLEGDIVEVVEFGAFVGAGPLDALLHVSQIADEYISFDEKQSRLVGKEGGIMLREGDSVRTRIVTVSLNERNPRESKIGLTMRQPALGKLEELYRSEAMHEQRSEYLEMLDEEEGEEGGGQGTVECRECGEEFKQITASHLSTHDMTMDRYREKHGENVPIGVVG